jgi:hypothetical protein
MEYVMSETEKDEAELTKEIAGWIRDDIFAGRDAGESLYPVSERLAARIVAEVRAAQREADRGELSNFLFTIFDMGTQPNALAEADAILEFLAIRGASDD